MKDEEKTSSLPSSFILSCTCLPRPLRGQVWAGVERGTRKREKMEFIHDGLWPVQHDRLRRVKHHHIYSDGKIAFHATKARDDSLFVWALYRLNIVGGAPIPPIVADSIAGYMQTREGDGERPSGDDWYVLKVGNANTKKHMVSKPYAAFERDVLPNLQHVADSPLDYVNR